MLAKKTVFIVEDEPDIAQLLETHFKREGCEVSVFATGEQVLRALRTKRCDLLLLDWVLPGLSGIEVLRIIRLQAGLNLADLPILMVTARDEVEDVVRGLETGANDYIGKPFDIRVVIARSQNLIRGRHFPNRGQILRVGEIELNSSLYSARCGSEEMALTRSEFEILSALLSNAGRILPRKTLIEHAQTRNPAVTERTIDTHMVALRKKLGKRSQMIETVRGIGYRMTWNTGQSSPDT